MLLNISVRLKKWRLIWKPVWKRQKVTLRLSQRLLVILPVHEECLKWLVMQVCHAKAYTKRFLVSGLRGLTQF